MKQYNYVLITILVVVFNLMLNGQSYIWSENFPYADGTIEGSGIPPKWTRNISSCNLQNIGDYVEVRSQALHAMDTDGEAVINFETIDISAYTDVSISFYLSEIGSLDNDDYFRVYYVLDGGSETLFETNGQLINDFGNVFVSQTGLNGNSLSIVIRMDNDEDGEAYIVDKLFVYEPMNGDDCGDAIPVSEVTDLPFLTVFATPSGAHPGCGGGDDPVDIWYSYTATATGVAAIDLCGSSFQTRLAVWDACGGAVLACNDKDGPVCDGDQSSIWLPVVSGQTYNVQIGGKDSQIGIGDLTIALYANPTNDDCANATPVGEVTDMPFATIAASASGANPGCGGSNNPVDIWYTYTAAATGVAAIDLCGSSFQTRLAVWDACGGAVLACNDKDGPVCDGDQSSIWLPVVSGQTYYVQIGGKDSQIGIGDLTIALYANPTNDDCANVTPVGEVTDMPFATIAASASGAHPGCGGGDDPIDIWYSYTATATGVAAIDLCGSSFQTRLAVWDACGGAVLACNDKNGPVCDGDQSSIWLPVVSGQTYYVQIGGKDSEIGIGDLTIALYANPTNDDCANAIPVGEVTDMPFATIAASASGAHPGCGGGDDPVDIWYSYTATATGVAAIDLCGSSFQTRLAVWDACGGAVLACNDKDGPVCDGDQSSIWLPVVSGQTYYVQIGGKDSQIGIGDLSIALYANPTNDDCANATPVGEVTDMPFATIAASTSGAHPGCGGGDDPYDVWFEYTASVSGSASFDLCGSEFDTRLAVWDACGGAVLDCNDDDGPVCPGTDASLVILVTAGSQYYVQIGGHYEEVGIGDLTIQVIEFEGNDDCASAIAINEVADRKFSTLEATASGVNPGCGGGDDPVDIWYAYTANFTGMGTFNLCGSGFDTRLAIWDACGGSLIDCNDNDGPACPGDASSIELPVYAGMTYYVQVGGHYAETGIGDLTISVYTSELWTGAINGDWTNPGNWGNGIVPQILTDVTIPGNMPNYPVIDKVTDCNNLQIYNGGELTCIAGGDLTVNGDLTNGSGSSGLFRMDDGACTVSGNYYSDIGSTTDINGGAWSFDNWNGGASSVWGKGNIHLSGGIINCAGSVLWSDNDVTGFIDGPVTVNIGGSFRNSLDDWTITDGTFNMLGTADPGGKDEAEPFYILASTLGPGNFVATPQLNVKAPEQVVYSFCAEGDVTGVWVLDDIRVDSCLLVTEIGSSSKSKSGYMNDYVTIGGNLIIGPLGKVTANVSESFNVLGDAYLEADLSNSASLIDNGKMSVAGTGNVQQYLSSDRWHLVTPPVTGATIATYLDVYLTEFNEPDNSWTFLVEPTTMPMNTMQGYAAWADEGVTGTTTVNYNGVLNTGDYYIPSFSYTLTSPNTGWNLIGNPYPSSIQWNSSWPKTDLSDWACIHNDFNDGCYNAVTGAEWPNIGAMPNGTIGPTQGFWVRATSDLANMTFQNSERMHNNQPIYKESSVNIKQSLRIRVDGNNDFDAVLIQFTEGATAGYDKSFDLEKRWGDNVESPNLYTIHNEETLYSVDVRQHIESELVIPIGFEAGLSGNFEIDVTQFDGFTGEYQVILEDIREGVFTELEKNTKYEFSSYTQDEKHRFNLHFKDLYFNLQEEVLHPVHIYSFENNIYVLAPDNQIKEVIIYNIMGQEVLRENGTNESVLKVPVNFKMGFYVVIARTSDIIITEKVFLK
ncbi:MAG: T9SS type A sorting domain-containing protein [Bacteroidales bacterium]|nr:T9SS type A sorting domain-containing protein [Bacteroidales bacterium]